MSTTDIVLAFPAIRKISTSYRSAGTPPLGLAYLAAICEKEGYSIKFFDLNLDPFSPAEIDKFLKASKPRALGVSFVTEARFAAFGLFKLAKKADPSIITIAGGPHATLCAEDSLKHVEELDFIVRGEGEETFADLMRYLIRHSGELEDINGISYRRNGSVIHNRNRLPIKDLDSLPFPALHRISFERYIFKIEVAGFGKLRAAPVLSSRGCPFSCNFCATAKVWGSKWRFRTPANVMEEIEDVRKKYRIDALWFVDDNFNAHNERAIAICDEMIKRKSGLKWICNVRVDNMKREHLEAMAAAGCISVEFGAESGSQRILDEVVGKKIKVGQIVDVDRWCSELGIVSDAQFVVSHPTETFSEAKETINLMRRLKGKSTLQILKVYPGTKVEEAAVSIGLLPQGFSWAKDIGATDLIPSIVGDAPLFIDKMTINEITELMTIAWTELRSISMFSLVKKALSKARSPKELFKLIRLGFPILIRKFKRRV